MTDSRRPFDDFDQAVVALVAALREWRATRVLILQRPALEWGEAGRIGLRLDVTHQVAFEAGKDLAAKMEALQGQAIHVFEAIALVAAKQDAQLEVLALVAPVGLPS